MAREMTPQERADFDKLAVRIFNKLTVHKQDEMKHDYRADERLIAEALIATRRAALLEAAEFLKLTPMLTKDNAIAVLTKLAQEG